MAQNDTNINFDISVNNDSGLKSVRSMRLELRDMSKELIYLEDLANKAMQMGDEKTVALARQRHAERTAQMAALKNDVGDLAKAQKMLDPGELLSGWVKLGQGLVGAFGSATSAMSLFGVESKGLQELEKKSMEIIKLMMGLEQARQILIDQGGRAQIKQLIETTAMQYKKIAAYITEALTIKAVEGQAKAATIAQRLWNLAVAQNPIGAIVVAVAALGAAIYILTQNQKENTSAMTEAIEKHNEEFKAMVTTETKMQDLTAVMTDATKTEKERNKAKDEYNKIAKDNNLLLIDEIGNQDQMNALMTVNAYLTENRMMQKIAEMELIETIIKLREIEERARVGALTFADIQEADALVKKRERLKIEQKSYADMANIIMKYAAEGAEGQLKMYKWMLDNKMLTQAEYDEKVKNIDADIIKKDTERKENSIQSSKEVRDARIQFEKDVKNAELDLADRIEQERINNMADGLEKELEQLKFNKMLEIREYTEANAKIQADDKLTKKQKEQSNKIFRENILFLNKKYDTAENKLLDESLNKELEKVKAITDANTAANLIEEEQRKAKLEKAKGMLNELADANEVAIIKALDDEAKAINKRLEKFQEIAQASSEVLSFISAAMKQSSDQRIADIDAQYKKESDSLKYKLDNDLITQEQYDKRSEQLTKAKDSRIRKEKQEAWKKQHRIDVANATAQAAIAVAQVFAYESGELVIKSIAAATAAAIAAGNVALIASQKMPQFARGGMLNGPSHAAGGIPIEAEGGEAIINARSMSNPVLRNLASAINVEGGGVSFAAPISNGLSTNTSSNATATLESSVIDEIVNKIAAIPVIVSEQDITKTQRKVQVIENKITH